MKASAIILAAGAGTRMKSNKPKVAHDILGKPLVRYVVDSARDAGIERIVSVIGHGADLVAPLVDADTECVIQEEQKGTADAVAICRAAFDGFSGSLLVLSGDCPLITAETLGALAHAREEAGAAACVLTMEAADPFGYGRIVRDCDGSLLRIVEQKDCSDEEALITECNTGFYCFDAEALFSALAQVSDDNAQGEYYLTDVLGICRAAGRGVIGLKVDDEDECLGVNSRSQLAQATKAMQRRINGGFLDRGVTMVDPDLVWIGPDVEIAADVEILPLSFLSGSTKIGSESIIGPNTRLSDTQVGRGCVMDETVAVEAVVEDGCDVGPRAYLRPGTILRRNAKVGTHVEIKKSTIGEGSKVPHLSYIGDAMLGADVNIGAGSITCNYDGVDKWPTTIGDRAFVGSDTMFVAPVVIGADATIGAGSVITRDVPAGSLGIARGRQVEVPGWADRKKGEADGTSSEEGRA